MKYKTVNRNCPICGCKEKTHLFSQKFAEIDGATFLNGYDVVNCNTCGFIYSDNIPNQKLFDEYYASCGKYIKGAINLHDISEDELMKAYDKEYNFMKEAIYKQGKNIEFLNIIDVGCGSGLLLQYLQKNNCKNISGIEPTKVCCDFLTSVGINNYCTTINNFDKNIQKFDLLISTCVFEHIIDLNEAIICAKNILNNDSFMCIQVPNELNFYNIYNAPFQDFSTEHINFFNINTLNMIMSKHGFRYIDYIEINPKKDDTIIVMYKLDINEKLDIKFDKIGVSLINKYIEKNIQIENKLYDNIEKYVISQEPIMVWGLGTYTLRQLLVGNLSKCNIKYFVEKSEKFNNKTYNGIEIIKPEDIDKDNDIDILVSSYYAKEAIINYGKDILMLKNKFIEIM